MASTTLLLVRHGAFEGLGTRFFSRADGPPLSAAGQAAAQRLARRLEGRGITWVYTSPFRRALDTATTLARQLDRPLEVEPALGEIQTGQWDLRPFDALAGDPAWTAYNAYRTSAAVPGGELALAAQARTMAALLHICARHDGQTVAVVSHADIIRGAIAACLGISLDLLTRIVVDPTSVSEVVLGGVPSVVSVNDRGGDAPGHPGGG